MTDISEDMILNLERDYPLVNVRPIAQRVSTDPKVHHPEALLRALVRKAQEKAERDSKHGREVAEKRTQMEREGDAFAQVYSRFCDWFNQRLLECKTNNLTGPQMADFFAYHIGEYEEKRGRDMHPYFARIMDYHLARWKAGRTDAEAEMVALGDRLKEEALSGKKIEPTTLPEMEG
jgi:hypothetical protein